MEPEARSILTIRQQPDRPSQLLRSDVVHLHEKGTEGWLEPDRSFAGVAVAEHPIGGCTAGVCIIVYHEVVALEAYLQGVSAVTTLFYNTVRPQTTQQSSGEYCVGGSKAQVTSKDQTQGAW